MTSKQIPVQRADTLFHELRSLIEETRSSVAVTVNTALTMLYWRVGKRISKELLQGERATYGAEILPTLSAKLSWSHFLTSSPLKNCLLSHAKPRKREDKKGKRKLGLEMTRCVASMCLWQGELTMRVLRGFPRVNLFVS